MGWETVYGWSRSGDFSEGAYCWRKRERRPNELFRLSPSWLSHSVQSSFTSAVIDSNRHAEATITACYFGNLQWVSFHIQGIKTTQKFFGKSLHIFFLCVYCLSSCCLGLWKPTVRNLMDYLSKHWKMSKQQFVKHQTGFNICSFSFLPM